MFYHPQFGSFIPLAGIETSNLTLVFGVHLVRDYDQKPMPHEPVHDNSQGQMFFIIMN